MKNILFFLTNHGRPNMVFEIQAEIIIGHLLKGDIVNIVVDLEGDIFKSQSVYPKSSAKKIAYNLLFEKLKLILVEFKDQVNIHSYLFKDNISSSIGDYLKNDEVLSLKGMEYKGYNIGYGVSSSLITNSREHKLKIKNNKSKVLREIKVSEIVIDTIEYYSKLLQPDLVYIFNGRLAANAPLVNFCKNKKINFKVFEFTTRKDKYHLVDNSIPHDLPYRNKEMEDLWNDESVNFLEKEKIGKSFFQNQMNGIELLEESFLKFQDRSFKINKNKDVKIISFFNSSIDEFASVPNWDEYVYIYENEVHAIEAICNRYRDNRSYQFILRIHPNLKFLNNSQIKSLRKLERLANLKIIEPDSSVYSYELIKKSDLTIVFGSTIGVEACFLGKPAISLGKAFYENIDVVYFPKTEKELFDLIECNFLKAKPKENTYKYGYWLLSYGEDFKKYEAIYPNDFFKFSTGENRKIVIRRFFSIEVFSWWFNYPVRNIFNLNYLKFKLNKLNKI
jgi:hypothetical protein